MPKQNWRKKSADSRKITTFADCLCAEKDFIKSALRQAQGPLLVSRPEVPQSTTIKQFNSQQHNNINGNQQQIQPFGS